MPDHDRARRRRLGREALQPARAADPVAASLPTSSPTSGADGRDGVVVVRLDPHDARLLGRPEPDREHRPERDRHLAEDVARTALADDALDPVDELDRLDAALEHGEERPLVALVRRVLARHEADVGRRAGEPLALRRAESREDRDAGDLVGRHHGAPAWPRMAHTLLASSTPPLPRDGAGRVRRALRREVSDAYDPPVPPDHHTARASGRSGSAA